jgi:hypothetical protein
VVECDQLSDSANPEPLPISTLPKNFTLQKRLMTIGTDIDNVEMITTDDGGRIPAQHQQFVEVWSKKQADTHPQQRQFDNPIELEPDYKLPYGLIYNRAEFELKMLRPRSKGPWRTL